MVAAPKQDPEAIADITDVQRVAEICKALADPARLRIMVYLATHSAGGCCSETGVCACDLEAVTELSQPTVSYHMKCLTQSGLVIGLKRGRWMYYRIDPRGLAPLREVLPLLMG